MLSTGLYLHVIGQKVLVNLQRRLLSPFEQACFPCIISAMEVITSHIGTDFDSLAAMVAAKRLYPHAELVFSGSQEKGVRNYLAQEFQNIYVFNKTKHIDSDRLTRLILVDTRQPSRLGEAAAWLARPQLSIHIYDHHPVTPEDVHGEIEEIHAVGSTTTVFVRLFKEQGIIPTPEEATLMALGIHADTGNFLHVSTCAEDLEAMAWLMGHGANLDIVGQFVSHDLTSEQVALLSRLQEQAHVYVIHGISIVICTLTEENYINDFSQVVQRLMTMDNLDALFTLVSLGERTSLIARSRIPEINVGTVAREFGGGGHASAASATIRDLTLAEAEDRLVEVLHNHVHPKAVAMEMMSAPVITVTPEVTITQANGLMTRYNVTVLPVVRENNGANNLRPRGLLGMISRTVVEKAIFHQLGNLQVSEYMTTDVASLPDNATLADVQDLIVGHKQRLIPVVREENIVGVITRTDLIGLLINDPERLPGDLLRSDEHPSIERARNLSTSMAKVLPRDIIVLLREIGETAQAFGCNAYVAGGFVRDLLLQIQNTDIDIVVEGDGILFARHLAEKRQGMVHPHEKFGTATVIFPDRSRIDVATARLEYYDHPAARPRVELSSIKLDLYRRDFTINAMAIHLNPERFGVLVDYFNGQNDLKERRIQVLHNLSFVEDPTRIFRAIRFESRLDFTITRLTEKLIKNTVKINLLARMEPPHLFHELQLILEENNPIPALRRMAAFNLFPLLWPDLRPNLKIDRRFIHYLTQANQALAWYHLLYLPETAEQWMVYLLAIFSRSRPKDLDAFCTRFGLSSKQRDRLLQQKLKGEQAALLMYHQPSLTPSQIYRLLIDLAPEGWLYVMTIARKRYIKQNVSLFVTQLRTMKPLLSGDTLKKQGYKPGPQFRTILDALFDRQLDGDIKDATQALEVLDRTSPLPQGQA